MTRHTYLMKSRHGVYYLRVVLSAPEARCLGRKTREQRVSLRTKSRNLAKRRLLQRLNTMMKHAYPEPWEAEVDEQFESYRRGLALIELYGRHDPDDYLKWEAVREALSDQELRDYAWVHEYDHRLRTAAPRDLTIAAPQAPATALPPAVADVRLEDAPIAAAIDRFVVSKKTGTRDATADKYGAQCRLFLKIVSAGAPVMHLSHLSVTHLRAYIDCLPQLPKRALPNDPRSIPDMIAAGGERMAGKTRFSHVRAVHLFLEWCRDQAYPVPEGFSGILKMRKPKSPDREKAFSTEDLKRHFGSSRYREGSFKRPADYWVPLLGLFTGAREAELCQLHLDDVTRDEATGCWVVSFNGFDNKQLKTNTSHRQVPLHPVLLELGFEAYLDQARGRHETRLFPDDERNNRGEFGSFSKRYNRYRKLCGITNTSDTKKDFHSFRHTFANFLTSRGADEYVINRIIGHSSSGKSESVTTYGAKDLTMAKKWALIQTLEWDVDFTAMKPNGWKQGT